MFPSKAPPVHPTVSGLYPRSLSIDYLHSGIQELSQKGFYPDLSAISPRLPLLQNVARQATTLGDFMV